MNELDLIEIPKTYYLNFNSLNGKPGWIKQQQIFRDKPFYTYTHYGLPNSSLIHNETGPAYIETWANHPGKVYMCKWFFQGNLHKLDGPSSIEELLQQPFLKTKELGSFIIFVVNIFSMMNIGIIH